MELMLTQLFYRLMRDEGLTEDQLHSHMIECRPERAVFSEPTRARLAAELAQDFVSIAAGEVAL